MEIRILTLDPKAYYEFASMLKACNIPYKAALPGEQLRKDVLILTTRTEATNYELERTLLREDMSHDPLIFKCQILSKLLYPENKINVGLDPGKRIGLAISLGNEHVGTTLFQSRRRLREFLEELVSIFPRHLLRIRVGDRGLSLAFYIRKKLNYRNVLVELVNESGTSKNRIFGSTKDQSSAVRIMLKRGRIIR